MAEEINYITYKPYQHDAIIIGMNDLGCKHLKTTDTKIYFEVKRHTITQAELKRMAEAIIGIKNNG